MVRDKEFVMKTLKVWQPYSRDRELNVNEALTVITNTSAFFNLLNDWNKEAESKKES